jgi:hypothetical protein
MVDVKEIVLILNYLNIVSNLYYCLYTSFHLYLYILRFECCVFQLNAYW